MRMNEDGDGNLWVSVKVNGWNKWVGGGKWSDGKHHTPQATGILQFATYQNSIKDS
jgi:hypothetical protein